MIMCSTQVDSAPAAPRFCSYHARPNPCAAWLVTTSVTLSPFTSKATISAPPPARPKAAGWYVHVVVGVTVAGCSHHPYGSSKSTRPSPLMSPAPTPCTPQGPCSDTTYRVHMPVGLAGSGLMYWRTPPPTEMTSGFLSLSRSRNTMFSDVTAGEIV